MIANFPLGSTAIKGEVFNTTGVKIIETLKHYEKIWYQESSIIHSLAEE
jgi:hypothetical protein